LDDTLKERLNGKIGFNKILKNFVFIADEKINETFNILL